jgi:pilus assembly protein CpaC
MQPAPTEVKVLVVPINGTKRVQIYTKRPIKKVDNPKEQVARVQPIANEVTEVMVVGLEPGITRITLTDIDGKEESFDVVVQFDVEYLKSLLRKAVPTANVEPVPGANGTIILTGTVAHAEEIDTIMRTAASVVGGATGGTGGAAGSSRIINALRVGGVQQVQLCVVIARVARSEIRRMAFDFLVSDRPTIFGSSGSGAVGNLNLVGQNSSTLGPFGALTDPLGVPGSAGTNFTFGVLQPDATWAFMSFLQALRDENLVKLLAEPRLVTLSGKEANFLSGGQTPVPSAGGLGVGGTDFVPFGTSLSFLPIVLGNGKIYLEVAPEVSNLDQANSVNIFGTNVAARTTQSVRTAVQLEPGQTLMIGGLIQKTTQANTRKVPCLGDMPFFGVFFRNIAFNEVEEELVILVTPHLVDAMSCDQLPKLLPGQETRTPDDFELFLEGILEAPRGQRQPIVGCHYTPAWKVSPTADKFPCGASLGIHGHLGHDGCCGGCGSCGLGGGCGAGGCANGSCGGPAEAGPDAPPPYPAGMPAGGVQQTGSQDYAPQPGMPGQRPLMLPPDAGRR